MRLLVCFKPFSGLPYTQDQVQNDDSGPDMLQTWPLPTVEAWSPTTSLAHSLATLVHFQVLNLPQSLAIALALHVHLFPALLLPIYHFGNLIVFQSLF